MYKSRENLIRLIRFSLSFLFFLFILFQIAAGETLVGSITVKGSSVLTRAEIRKHVKLTEGKVFHAYIFYNDVDNVKAFYTESGFPNALISGSYEEKEGLMHINIDIVENEPEVIAEIQSSSGLAESVYEKYKGKRWTKMISDTIIIGLKQYYQNRGYYKPNIDVKKRAGDGLDVTLEVHVETGPEYHFGDIYCVGLETVPVRYVTREAGFEKGDLFDMRKINKYQELLYQMGVFEDINMKIIDVDEIVNIIVEIKEGRSRWVGIDFGYTSPATGRIGFEWGTYNLWNKLHRLIISNSNEIDFSDDNYLTELNMTYQVGWIMNRRLNAGLVTSLKNEKADEGLNNELSLKGFLKKDFSGGNYIIGGYEKKLNYYSELYDESVDIELEEWLITNRLFMGLYWDTLDNKVHPERSGFSFQTKIEYNGDFMEGDFTYLKMMNDTTYYKYILEETTLAVAHAAYDNIFSLNGVMNPPYDELFSLGGAFDLRGYQYQEIGDDFYSVLTGNIELRQKIKGLFWGALFMDAAAASGRSGHISLYDIYTSYGAGIRYVLPFIIIRLDYGIYSFKEEGTLHFVLGHIF